MSENSLKYTGTEIQLRSTSFVLPPYSFKTLRTEGVFKKLSKVQKFFSTFSFTDCDNEEYENLFNESLCLVEELVYLALKQNYPDVTREQVENELSLDAISDILPILISQSKRFNDVNSEVGN
jgi:hypothetical protein